MVISRWKTIHKKVVLKGLIFRYSQVKRESRESGKKADFDVLDCLNWVNIVAKTREGNIVLVKQYRHGCDDITYEIPGGAVDPGEDPFAAAKRISTPYSGSILSAGATNSIPLC